MNAAAVSQVAKHLNVVESMVVRVEEWANCLFAVVKGLGARFVSKKVVKVEKRVELKNSLLSLAAKIESAPSGLVDKAWYTVEDPRTGQTFCRVLWRLAGVQVSQYEMEEENSIRKQNLVKTLKSAARWVEVKATDKWVRQNADFGLAMVVYEIMKATGNA